MSTFWVDTDFGFDDLWALLVLRHLGAQVAGISLVAGNAPLARVVSNAMGARQAYGIDAPIYAGADRPLVRDAETAERILGPRGMQSRGQHLPDGGPLTETKMQTQRLRHGSGLPNRVSGAISWPLDR